MKLTLNIEPKPQSRPRFTRQGRAYDDPKMKAWRNHCQLIVANQYMGQDILVALHDVGKFYSLNPRIEIEIEEIKWKT